MGRIKEIESGLLPTLQAQDDRLWNSKSLEDRVAQGKQVMLTHIIGTKEKSVNPDWVDWYMGFPIGWSSLEPVRKSYFNIWKHMRYDYFKYDPIEAGHIEILIPFKTKTPETTKIRRRLFALGNSQVPLVAGRAYELLWGVVKHEYNTRTDKRE